MPLTIIVTRDVEARYRGFLTSVMLEISAGVYVAPDMSTGVRDRVWNVLTSWWDALRRGSLVMVWRDKTVTGHLQIKTLGEPPKQIVDADGILLVKRE
ncbi:type I-E CRISPR-associated endoribonuclease Cas2 [Roseibium aquae]|uniref:Type I-E CRISPR-associated endoribonuclease Cas2 n=1 Tax=Roseibium aquae TaxID=1323746 RepID=A0A916TKB0_9HYPH|nr:type I-E CRISPR-associated endoribonuclease Cas2e [Roseibium aquae]GGB49126.1 type I-E CRISPR-associated endoribonuclease Cas2 [Roseibium aquae]